MEQTDLNGDTPAVYIALGSNLGNRKRNLARALERLQPLVRIDAVSSLYETDPVGPQDQPAYLNAVCRVVTGLQPRALVRHMSEVEHEIGRRRGEPWGPRVIDLDLLLYGDAVISEDGLSLPHPEMHRRAFVLLPLAEIAPDARHPSLGKTAASLAQDIDASGVRLCEPAGWHGVSSAQTT